MIKDKPIVKEYNMLIATYRKVVEEKGYKEVVIQSPPLPLLIEEQHNSNISKVYYIQYPVFGVHHFLHKDPTELNILLGEMFKPFSFKFKVNKDAIGDDILFDAFEAHSETGLRIMRGGTHYTGIGFEINLEKVFE